MLKQAQLAGITIVLVVASTAGGVYLWWQSQPQFALLEARNGYLLRENKRFNKYVDVATLTTGFTEEIIFEPAEKTPNLTKLQRVIGLGALHAARTGIDNSLIFQIQRLVQEGRQPKVDSSVEASVGAAETADQNAANDGDGTTPDASPHETAAGTTGSGATESGGEAKGDKKCESMDDASPGTEYSADGKKILSPKTSRFGFLVRQQWRKEKQRLKSATFERMNQFARKHPDTLINRIFAAPTGHRANAVKEILAECGFKGKNFKKYLLEKKGTKVIAHLTFFSPRINDLVTVKLEMERLKQGPFGRYRISRLVDFKKTLTNLNYDTDQQIQGLVAYGLQDLNGMTIAGKAKEVMREIGESVNAAERAGADDGDYDNDDD
ncbi:MAG: hypothetical protein SGJ27_19770 [Candidatus Melainabacteria bacterium]|nr:hypothetical protein [Candidatus Melainabacteria bacterium]